MAPENFETEFNNTFNRRVKEAREGSGLTQKEVADALSIPLERYKKYEQRSQLPHYLVERFCELTGSDIAYLFTGKHQPPPIIRAQGFDRRRR